MKRIVILLLALLLSWTALAADIAHNLAPPPRSVGKFLHDVPLHIGNDLHDTIGNPWRAAALLGGIGVILGVHQADNAITRDFSPAHRRLGNTFDRIVNTAANPFVLTGATFAAWSALEIAGARAHARVAGTMLEAVLLTEGITAGLQLATRRTRPDGSGEDSFPSGHTSGPFALAAVAQSYYGAKVGVPAFALATLAGVVRLDSQRHFASDVLAGALLGTLIGFGTAHFHQKIFPRATMLPLANAHGAGLGVIVTF